MSEDTETKGYGNQTVRFYTKPEHQLSKSQEEGRAIYEDKLFIRIETAGNALNIIDTHASDEHISRYPIEYANFKNKGENTVVGTPLNRWGILSEAQVLELGYHKFYTIENIANATDGVLNKITSIVGMDGGEFRKKALIHLDKDKAIEEQSKIIEELQKRIAKKEAEEAEEEFEEEPKKKSKK